MDVPLTLRGKLAARRVISFVGAGVSMAVCRKGSGERPFPSWKAQLLHAAERLDRENKSRVLVRAGLGTDSPDFPSIAAHAQKSLGSIWAPSEILTLITHGKSAREIYLEISLPGDPGGMMTGKGYIPLLEY